MELPSIHDADSPNLMINEAGDRFFPDSIADAREFAKHHEAWFVSPIAGWRMLVGGTERHPTLVQLNDFLLLYGKTTKGLEFVRESGEG